MQIVEARAAQGNRSVDFRRVDNDARRRRKHLSTIELWHGWAQLYVFLLNLGDLRALRVALALRLRDEMIEAEQHGDRQHHREKKIAVFLVHGAGWGPGRDWPGVTLEAPSLGRASVSNALLTSSSNSVHGLSAVSRRAMKT